MTYPILEFDPSLEAKIEPSRHIAKSDVPEHCVICFFREVMTKVVADHQAQVAVESYWEDGSHAIYEIEFRGQRLAFFHPGVGGPVAAGLLEEAIAYGCRKFIVCGGCGVLQRDIAVGHLVIVNEALRDEGASYHYLPPSRTVQAHPLGVQALEAVAGLRGVPYLVGKTWTTDAPYRETQAKIDARRAEGCLTVEMEAASLMAVGQFRSVVVGQILYGGDDLSGETWDRRDWQSRQDIRSNLFWLAAEACVNL